MMKDLPVQNRLMDLLYPKFILANDKSQIQDLYSIKLIYFLPIKLHIFYIPYI